MKITDTISVNPGKTALGHVENASSDIFRNPVIGAQSAHHSNDIVKILFPTAIAGNSEYRKYEVPLRTVFATILILSGITVLNGTAAALGVAFAVCSICFGGCLAVGLFTRPVMLGASIFYCILGALSLRAGITDMIVFALMFGCLVFAIFGAGKYSCDTLIRKSIRHQRRARDKKRKEDMLSYKAFHNVKY